VYYQPVVVSPAIVDPFAMNASLLAQLRAARELNERAAPATDEPALPRKVASGPKPRDELETRAEMQRLLRRGNDAFGTGDYAQAVEHYRQAVSTAPLEPMGYFHLAQAYLATDKLAEAGVAIERGMRLRPGWPSAPFRPRALYRDLEADYDKHLAGLADLVGKNLNDDGLLFLLAYQLWFDGRQPDAISLFERAAALAMDTNLIDRFLAAGKMPPPLPP
jgi:tetratricopeptide (TPR) repeat protein